MIPTRQLEESHHHFTRRLILPRHITGLRWSVTCSARGRPSGRGAPQQKRYDLLIKGGRVVDPSQELSAVRDVAILGHTRQGGGRHPRGRRPARPRRPRQDRDAGPDRRPRPRLRRRGPAGHPGRPQLRRQGRHHGPRRRLGGRPHVPRVPQVRHRRRADPRPGAAEHLRGRPVDPVAGQPARRAARPELRQPRAGGADDRAASRRDPGDQDPAVAEHRRRERPEGPAPGPGGRRGREAADDGPHRRHAHAAARTSSPCSARATSSPTASTGARAASSTRRGASCPEVLAAVGRGVHLDVGHGAGSFSFDVAEKALKQDLLPGTISSDLHQFNIHGPVFDLATTLSKFLHLGLTLEQVIARVTTHPAKTFGFPAGLGTLREGCRGRRRGVRAPGRGFHVHRRAGPAPRRTPEAESRWRRSSPAGSTGRPRSPCPARSSGSVLPRRKFSPAASSHLQGVKRCDIQPRTRGPRTTNCCRARNGGPPLGGGGRGHCRRFG